MPAAGGHARIAYERAAAFLRRRRLRLAGLPRLDRAVTATALITCAAVGALILSAGWFDRVPGGGDARAASIVELSPGERCAPMSERPSIPRAVTLVGYAGLAISGACLARAAVGRRGAVKLAMIVAVAFVGAATAASLVGQARLVDLTSKLFLPSSGVRVTPFLALAPAWTGLATALALTPLSYAPERLGRVRLGWIRRSSWLLAAGPGAAGLAMYALSPLAMRVPASLLARPCLEGFDLGGILDPQSNAAAALEPILFDLQAVGPLLFFWLVIEGTRLTRDASDWIAGKLQHRRGLLAAGLGGKVVWIAAGLAGILPAWLGGDAEGWTRALRDGSLTWLLTIAIGVLVTWWLWHRRAPSITEGGFRRAAWLVVAGFSAVPVIAYGVLLAHLIRSELGPSGGDPEALVLYRLSTWFSENVGEAESWSWIAVIALSGALGIALSGRRRLRSTGLFLAGVFVWGVPFTVAPLLDLIDGPVGPLPISGVELITLDAVLTGSVVFLVLARVGGHQGPDLRSLTLVAVATGAVALPGTLVPRELEAPLLFAGLVLPAVGAFLLDAADLNEPVPERPAKVLFTVGVATGLLTAAAWSVGTGSLAPGGILEEDLARLVFLAPFLTLLLASSISARRDQERYALTHGGGVL
jgi:hypothetical protein